MSAGRWAGRRERGGSHSSFRQKGEGQVSMPITAMSDQLLTEALQAAASEDKFELAAILRDELKRRRQREEMYNLAANETISKTSSSEEQS